MIRFLFKTLELKFIVFFGFFLMSLGLYAQKITLSGKIQDSLQDPIPNTNVIATPVGETDQNVAFSIASQEGEYRLRLARNQPYKIEITSLGYASMTDTLQFTEDHRQNFTLYQSYEELEAAVVEAKMAMVVKEDTILYRVDKFNTGTERKLREVLKNLPGVEVDRDGNVTVNGKKVNKLMVDGEDFFGGDVKLGVNNIPADAVEEVEALDHYNEVDFMKGLSDSNRMAMDIKLKKDKKDFMFGESKVGGGVEKRYYAHPTLFYYSPKTTVNFIGSLNNVNESPMDFQDVTRFKGGYMSFMDNPIQSGDEGLTQFSSSKDVVHNQLDFAAGNVTRQLTKHTRLEAYSIVAWQKNHSRDLQDIEYLTQDNLLENRENTVQHKQFSNFNKIKLCGKPGLHKDWAYHLLVNNSNSAFDEDIHSVFADSLSQTRTLQDPHDVEISQFFRYNTQPTYEHTSEIKAKYTYKKEHALTDWDFDKPIFSGIIPFEEEGGRYNFLHHFDKVTHEAQASFKHYWVLNNTNHIYPKAGIYYLHQSYNSRDFQRLQDGGIHSFREAGFDNGINFQLVNPYIGFQYKVKLGEWIFRPGIFYQQYFWRVRQFGTQIARREKGVFLPELMIKRKFSTGNELNFNYQLQSSLKEAVSYANRYRLTGFNSLYSGNEHLENSLVHSASLSYRNFNIGKGMVYNLSLGYTRKEKSVQRVTSLEGIDQVYTDILSSLPENSYSFRGNFQKRWREIISLGFSGTVSLSDYHRILNEEPLKYNSEIYNYRIHSRTLFKDWPNLTFGLSQTFTTSKSDQLKNHFWSLSPYFDLDYNFLNGFTFKAEYSYSLTRDRSSHQSDHFQIGKASLYYNKEDSPWGFEIRVNNLFDVSYKRGHSFNEFMVYDRRVFIQPRTALFILSYQL